MNIEVTNLTRFRKIFLGTLKEHVLMKKKYICANHTNFITNDVRRTIMLRS